MVRLENSSKFLKLRAEKDGKMKSKHEICTPFYYDVEWVNFYESKFSPSATAPTNPKIIAFSAKLTYRLSKHNGSYSSVLSRIRKFRKSLFLSTLNNSFPEPYEEVVYFTISTNVCTTNNIVARWRTFFVSPSLSEQVFESFTTDCI